MRETATTPTSTSARRRSAARSRRSASPTSDSSSSTGRTWGSNTAIRSRSSTSPESWPRDPGAAYVDGTARVPRSRPRDAARNRPADRSDRARVGRAEDQRWWRRLRRGGGEPRDRKEDPDPAAPARLPGRDDPDGAGLPLRQRRQHRPSAVLQPPARGSDAPDPRRRVDEPRAARLPDPLPRLAPRLD